MDTSIKGRRIEYLACDDEYTPLPRGLQGTAQCIDDAGTLHVDWDNGSRLGLLPGIDRYRVVPDAEYAQ